MVTVLVDIVGKHKCCYNKVATVGLTTELGPPVSRSNGLEDRLICATVTIRVRAAVQ